MRKAFLVIGIVICFGVSAQCEDNLSVLGSFVKKNKEKEKTELVAEVSKPPVLAQGVKEEVTPAVTENNTAQLEEIDDTDKRVEDMKIYHDILDSKQKEIDIIKLDLEKQKLLLEKKEAQKKIYDIAAGIPESEKMDTTTVIARKAELSAPGQGEDIKILLLVVTDNLKEAVVAVGGQQSTVYEGMKINGVLTVESIKNSGVVFSRGNGETFVKSFIQ